MYIMGITDEDFIGFEAQMKNDKKQLPTHATDASLTVKKPHELGALNHIYMFKDASMSGGRAGSSIVEEKAAATA